jgi:uncharacterized protein (DUF2336 family)
LTQADVARLLANPAAESRLALADKVAGALDSEALSERERRLAEEIVRVMARDVEVRVRAALADAIKTVPGLPRDVALQMAADVSEVAGPILKFSDALTDDDLVAIVKGSDWQKQMAIAQRSVVSETVSAALVETRDERVVAELVANDGAAIPESSLGKVLDWFGSSDRVKTSLVYRATLPISISERLVDMVADRLRQRLATHHALPDSLASDLVMESRERATLSLVGPGAKSEDVEGLVRELHANGRLTESIILRAACLGDIAFLEAALAVRAKISARNAQALVQDGGGLGLQALCERAGLARRVVPALRAAIDIVRETDFDGLDGDRERHGRRLIERVLTRLDDHVADMAAEDIDYLLAKLTRFADHAHA